MKLIDTATESRRPEYARMTLIAATTGLRRGELCAIRRHRDIDWERQILTVAHAILEPKNQPLAEAPTKNRRVRHLAIDQHTTETLASQVAVIEQRAVRLLTRSGCDEGGA